MSQPAESRRSARIAGEVAPPPIEQPISLFCLVQGEPTEKAFPVDIEKSKTVGHLRKLIWEERQHTFSNVDAAELTLWAVSVPIGDGTVQVDLAQVEKRRLLPARKISRAFAEVTDDCVHVFIEPPTDVPAPTIIERRNLNTRKIQDADPPSSASQPKKLRKIQAGELLLCARPADCVGPPVHMYNEVFSKFLFDYNDEDLEPSARLCRWTIKFIRSMTDIYGDEDGRETAFQDFIGKLTNESLTKQSTTDGFGNDGMIEYRTAIGEVLIVNIEIKNEVGTGNCDPYIQGIFSYSKYWARDKYDTFRRRSNCPSFIIAMAGPWICIAGAVYLEKPVIAPLTDYISLMETYDTNHKHRIARLFQAFSNGINNLKAFYQQNIPAASSNLEFLYPFPCQYVDGQSTVRFSYIEPLKVDSVKHWKARNTEGKDIVIKFTQRYNEAAHKLCATKNMAPQLLYVGKEVYGWCMVVMEYVDGVTLSQANLTRDVYLEVLEKVEEAIKILHENNIVFGDLRPPNIMVQQNGGNPCVKLIDFDWAGRDQVDCYPPFMNHVHIKWPEGASDGKILQKKHDLVMLDYLKDNADQLNT